MSLQFRQWFQPYVRYCLRVKQTMAYAREQQDSNPLFRAFVQVGEGVRGKGDRWTLDNQVIPNLQLSPIPRAGREGSTGC